LAFVTKDAPVATELATRLSEILIEYDVTVAASALSYLLACAIAYASHETGADLETLVDNAKLVVEEVATLRLSQVKEGIAHDAAPANQRLH
jgi:hypothetical protein